MIENCPTCGDLYEEEGLLFCCGSLTRNCYRDDGRLHDWYADTGEMVPPGFCRCLGRDAL